MSKFFIGVMTGTSADALDGCIVSFENQFKLIESASINLEASYKKSYENCIKIGYKTVDESNILLDLEEKLNDKTIKLVKKLLKDSNLDSSQIESVAFSGQTVFHTDQKSYQIGNATEIAKSLGIKVVSDFRNFDISKGGKGAPLIPAFHNYLYSEENKKVLIFNIGGIANGTYLNDKKIVLASDIGPGNCLIDFVASEKLNKRFDENGESAKTGKLSKNVIENLIKEYDKKFNIYPRADDKRNYYYLLETSVQEMNPNDALRNLTELTAQKIKDFFDYCNKPEEVIFHGGGTKNLFLMSLIENKLGQKIKTTDDQIMSKFVEAAGFAYLAYLNKGVVYDGNAKL